MNKEENYASDSDQSDEDFCPDKANTSDVPSEEDSDDPISENEDEPVSKGKQKTKKKANKFRTKASESPGKCDNIVATRNRGVTDTKSSLEKDELESDEEDTSRKDALWADFLSDVSSSAPSKPAVSNRKRVGPEENKKPETKLSKPVQEKKITAEPAKANEKVIVTEVFDFAGEEVRVEKAVSADSLKENGSKKTQSPAPARGPAKRPGGAGGVGGIGSILGQIGKKKKISVLEKTKLDWDSFKTNEGIDEQLQTHNKGKDGYLERQDFLERTDLRQFEIEKSVRQARRKPM